MSISLPVVLSSDDEEGKDSKAALRPAPDSIPGPCVPGSDPQPQDSPSALEQLNMLYKGSCSGRKDRPKAQVTCGYRDGQSRNCRASREQEDFEQLFTVQWHVCSTGQQRDGGCRFIRPNV